MSSVLGPSSSAKLRNKNCVYCGVLLTKLNKSREHLIGTRFVPKGTLNNEPNVILNACENCNNIKSSLEDDISAISMIGGGIEISETEQETLVEDAQRKARGSHSKLTGKPVAESFHKTKIKYNWSENVSFTLGFVAPPLIDPQRIELLAKAHMMGVFYCLTYDEKLHAGKRWPGDFMPHYHAFRSDWGNPALTDFAHLVSQWEPNLIMETANGFFKVALRRNPSKVCWSWALEWNQNLRVVGFLGDQDAAQEITKKIRKPAMKALHDSSEGTLRTREEVSLNDEDDFMFFPK